MLHIGRKLLTSTLLSILLVACGGGGGESSPTSSETSVPKPIEETSVLSPDLTHGYFEIENSGIANHSTIKFSPFHTDSVIEASATNNNMWNLEILTPSNDLSAHINNLAGLYFYPNDDKVGVFSYSENANGYLRVQCQNSCSDTFSYKIEKQSNGKTYFIIDANGSITGRLNNIGFASTAKIKGSVKFEVNSDWPVWDSKRFNEYPAKSDLIVNGKPATIEKFLDWKTSSVLSFTTDKEYYFNFNNPLDLDHDRFILTEGNYFSNEQPKDVYIYKGYFNRDFTLNTDYENGITTFKFINNLFTNPVEYTASPDLEVFGGFVKKIPYGQVIAGDEVFKIDETVSAVAYAENESKYYRFMSRDKQSDLEFTVKYDTITKNVNVAYQRPQKGQLNVNIYLKWNCKLTNNHCSGVTVNDSEGTIEFKNVQLDDGRLINGKFGHLGVNDLLR
ncbi:hypothetical protein [Acinetobacter amyesii]|uniref:hypothetical protein n=1 Tax=Acinetobacter amyesii TaxID=2942470 RepID=UPI0020BE66CF|nr:hypothetical protein [Acinetobacter amyesii]MCL6232651.1 hypothetical protein [Acinetobacter amyesii]